jgi:hypothetical protein
MITVLEYLENSIQTGVLPSLKSVKSFGLSREENAIVMAWLKKRLFIELERTNDDEKITKLIWKLKPTQEEKRELLLSAVNRGNKRVVRFLYSKGMADFGEALLLAVQNNNPKLVKYLAKRDRSGLWRARALAERLGHGDLLEYLVV